MAEFLIVAKKHWMDELTPTQVALLPRQKLDTYNARSQVGDILVVRPDGWKWGKEERLPNYIVVKIPGLKADKKYEELLISAPIFISPLDGIIRSKILKRRKYRVPILTMNALTSLGVSVIGRMVGDFVNILEAKIS